MNTKLYYMVIPYNRVSRNVMGRDIAQPNTRLEAIYYAMQYVHAHYECECIIEEYSLGGGRGCISCHYPEGAFGKIIVTDLTRK